VHSVPAATRPIPLIRSVLVATDLSDLGNAAIPHAYAMARRSAARIEICHVHERTLPGSSSQGLAEPPSDLTTAQRQQLERDLAALVPREADELGITTEVSVIDGGSAAHQILQAAQRLGVDALVLSSHGRGGLGRVLFGSVAHAVLHKSPVPVTIVPPARGM
jgi:nucleotide-binding universal stress UspA family protein